MSDDDMLGNELSKVEIHLKNNLNSSKAVTRPKENEDSIKVEIHLKEDKKSSKVKKGPKDRIRFRERNGAAYQVPNNWEELYEKDEATKAEFSPYEYVDKQRTIKKRHPSKLKGMLINKRVTDIISDTKDSTDTKKPDYYTSLRKDIQADLKFANDFGYINTKMRSSRWNKKHLDEIERDKREVESWFESGIVYKAVAPKQTKEDPESDGVDPEAYEEIPKSKEITLGDYISTIPVKVTEIDNFDDNPSGEIENVFTFKPIEGYSLSNDDKRDEDEIDVLPSHPDPDFENKQACFKSRCKYYHETKGIPYPDCGGESESSDSDSDVPCNIWCADSLSESEAEKPSPEMLEELAQPSSEMLKELAQKVISNITSKTGKENMMKYNEKRRKSIPLCKHGYIYHVQHFADSIYFEADHMMELMPRKRLYDFAEAMRVLSGLIENLRSDHNRKLFDCQPEYCLWNITSNKGIEERCTLNTFCEPVRDSVSFEVRVKQVCNPRYGLRTLLKDSSYDPTTTGVYSEYLLGLKHNKALEALENHKLLEFPGHIERFTCFIFGEISDMQKIMKTHDLLDENRLLTSGLHDYHAISWRIQRQEAFEKCSKLQCCGPLFRSRKTKDSTIDSDFESGPSINIPVDYEQISTQSLSRQMETLDVEDTMSKSVPKPYCPSLIVECFSPRWQYQSGGNTNKSQDLDPTKKEVADDTSFTTYNKSSTSESIDEVETGSVQQIHND